VKQYLVKANLWQAEDAARGVEFSAVEVDLDVEHELVRCAQRREGRGVNVGGPPRIIKGGASHIIKGGVKGGSFYIQRGPPRIKRGGPIKSGGPPHIKMEVSSHIIEGVPPCIKGGGPPQINKGVPPHIKGGATHIKGGLPRIQRRGPPHIQRGGPPNITKGGLPRIKRGAPVSPCGIAVLHHRLLAGDHRLRAARTSLSQPLRIASLCRRQKTTMPVVL